MKKKDGGGREGAETRDSVHLQSMKREREREEKRRKERDREGERDKMFLGGEGDVI